MRKSLGICSLLGWYTLGEKRGTRSLVLRRFLQRIDSRRSSRKRARAWTVGAITECDGNEKGCVLFNDDQVGFSRRCWMSEGPCCIRDPFSSRPTSLFDANFPCYSLALLTQPLLFFTKPQKVCIYPPHRRATTSQGPNSLSYSLTIHTP
ncbi:hypothetical protein EV363DRAFT_756639 [Boletus edulis]|nr:hypothetical protein EV363DRAFT_756639 [Boletus edulis]